jgi:uncharacterized protein (DUF2344 family)
MLPNNLSLSQMITKINKSLSDEKWQLSDPKKHSNKRSLLYTEKFKRELLF